jgi:hypothetical protein
MKKNDFEFNEKKTNWFVSADTFCHQRLQVFAELRDGVGILFHYNGLVRSFEGFLKQGPKIKTAQES